MFSLLHLENYFHFLCDTLIKKYKRSLQSLHYFHCLHSLKVLLEKMMSQFSLLWTKIQQVLLISNLSVYLFVVLMMGNGCSSSLRLTLYLCTIPYRGRPISTFMPLPVFWISDFGMSYLSIIPLYTIILFSVSLITYPICGVSNANTSLLRYVPEVSLFYPLDCCLL